MRQRHVDAEAPQHVNTDCRLVNISTISITITIIVTAAATTTTVAKTPLPLGLKLVLLQPCYALWGSTKRA